MNLSIFYILISVLCIFKIQSANNAQQSLALADQLLNYKYDYPEALQQFEKTISLCESDEHDNETHECALIGLAMCHHHFGRYEQRDACMQKAQQLLNIPSNPLDYKTTIYRRSAVNFFTMDGYRSYIDYEKSYQNGQTPKQQEKLLFRAKDLFDKALNIAQLQGQITIEATHALHGLGTIYEFLYKIPIKTKPSRRCYLLSGLNRFRQALHNRITLLGDDHPLVARTHHKLARNYNLLNNKEKAVEHYNKAVAIYDACNINKNHPKYKELSDEVMALIPHINS